MAKGKTLADAFVRVLPDGSRFPGELQKQVAPGAGSAGKNVGTTFGKGIVAGMGAVFAAGAVIDFFKGAIAEAQEAAKVTALTAAVIKSTGGAARVSAKDVDTLANSLSDLAGVDDETIASGANLLLTFTKVRNEVGKGNDVFNQATGLALDMSQALGKDLQGSITMVGKALNDPIAGLTALRKVGVAFTESQRDQIKTMVEAGDVLGAQKVILAELAVEFGGAAAAMATPADKAKVAWANFQEEIGNKLLPTINNLLTFATENSDWLAPLLTSAAALAAVIGTVVAAQKGWTLIQSAFGVGVDGSTGKVRKATVAVAAYALAVQGINAAVGTSVKPQIDALSDSIEEFGRTGESGGEVARLFGDDMGKLDTALANATSSGRGFATWMESIIPGAASADRSWTKNIERIDALDQALAQSVASGNANQAQQAFTRLWNEASNLGITLEQLQGAFPEYTAAAQAAAKGVTGLSEETANAADAGQDLIDVWNEINNTLLEADDAMLKAWNGLDDIKEAFKEGTKAVEGNSREVLENRVALEREAQAAQEAAAKALANGESHDSAAALIAQFKEQAIAATGATGAEAEQIRALAERLFSLPPNVNTTVTLTNITRNIVEYQEYRSGERQADGGIVKFFADGGVESHIAQIVKAGTWRIWGEPETGGEAYIPLGPNKRARSMQVLETVAREFGFGLAPVEAGNSTTVPTMGGGGVRTTGGGGGDMAALLDETRRTNALLAELLPSVAPGVAAALTRGTAAAFQLARARA